MFKSTLLLCLFLLSGCSGILEKQEPVCEGVALLSGKETTVQIYAVRKQQSQTQYKAGYPFNWQWISKNNFTRTTCDK
ncbi:cor protein [Erwinia persicina]|uniref:phage exclusion lipoprotein Cor n=1 Tax=Erwinia persicina TaxID=55211 RepID=UPI000930C9FD|nr:cor protein [Erwinia persicina]MBC3945830.1 cor protein [Erwinia persicina]MCQ4105145.1 cor protein [Erwinia persicina]UTX11361.1 cor protein [Erwinia persicina]